MRVLYLRYLVFFLASFFPVFLFLGKTVEKPPFVSSLIYSTEADKRIFQEYIDAFSSQKTDDLASLITKTALYFEGAPYVAATLERDPEGLVVNLREFDCTTFVENVLALAMTLKEEENPSFESFCVNLEKIRFRQSPIQNYGDRLHYFSDWIFENQRKNIIKDITKDLGGEKHRFNLFFMSANADKYEALKRDRSLLPLIVSKEREISLRNDYSVIPKQEIVKSSSLMRNGDIVCFVTDIAGLDISHVGIVYKIGEKTSFIHASSLLRKVVMEPTVLEQYCIKQKKNAGLILLRSSF